LQFPAGEAEIDIEKDGVTVSELPDQIVRDGVDDCLQDERIDVEGIGKAPRK
jgi:hypothetical protein